MFVFALWAQRFSEKKMFSHCNVLFFKDDLFPQILLCLLKSLDKSLRNVDVSMTFPIRRNLLIKLYIEKKNRIDIEQSFHTNT